MMNPPYSYPIPPNFSPQPMHSTIEPVPAGSPVQGHARTRNIRITNPTTHEPVVFPTNTSASTSAGSQSEPSSASPSTGSTGSPVPARSQIADAENSEKKLSFKETIARRVEEQRKREEEEKLEQEKKEETTVPSKEEEKVGESKSEDKPEAPKSEEAKNETEVAEKTETKTEKPSETKTEAPKAVSSETSTTGASVSENLSDKATDSATKPEDSADITTENDEEKSASNPLDEEDPLNAKIEASLASVNYRVKNPLRLLEKASRPSPAEVLELVYPESFKKPSVSSTKENVYLYDIPFLYQFQSIVTFPPKEKWEAIRSIMSYDKNSSGGGGYGKQFGNRSTSGRSNFSSGSQAMGNFGSSNFRSNLGDRSVSGPGMGGGFHMGGSQGKPPGRMPSVTNLSLSNFKSGRQNSSRRGRNNDRSGSNRGNRENSMHNNMGPNQSANLSARNSISTFSSSPSTGSPSDGSENAPPVEAPAPAPVQRSANAWVPRIRSKQPQVEDGKLTPEIVQRKVKSLLNKMTLENFETITDQILEISKQSKEEKDGRTLRQIIQLTFDKAVDEAHWSNMYARFCGKMLSKADSDIYDEGIVDNKGDLVRGGALFRKYLLKRCQDEFEQGWSDKLPTNADGSPLDPELMSDEYYAAMGAKRRGLGLIRFIGELYFLRMLTEKIIQKCMQRLLKTDLPSEEVIESICQLMTTVGKQLESSSPQSKSLVNDYFEQMLKIQQTPELPSRLRFMLMDVRDLRNSGWQNSKSDKGPKTVSEIHEQAQAEREREQRERSLNQGRKLSRRPGGSSNHLSSSELNALRGFGTMRSDSSFSRESSSRGSRRGVSNSSPGIALSKESSSRTPSQSNKNSFLALNEVGDGENHDQ